MVSETIDSHELPNSLKMAFQRYVVSGKDLIPMQFIPSKVSKQMRFSSQGNHIFGKISGSQYCTKIRYHTDMIVNRNPFEQLPSLAINPEDFDVLYSAETFRTRL